MTPIKILHVSTSTKGGASSAMLRIVDALESEPLQNYGCHYHGRSPSDRWTSLSRPKKYLSHPFYRIKLSRAKKGRPSSCESFTPTNPRRSLVIPKALMEDKHIINFHYLGGQIWDQTKLFRSVPSNCKIVITMHDLHQVTGGCHYPYTCEKYRSHCDHCPQLPGVPAYGICSESFREKISLFKERSITLVTPSRWLETAVRESAIGELSAGIHHIGYPFPESSKPIERLNARKKLGMEQVEKKIILLVAQDLNNKRKGTHLLIDALRQNRLPNCKVLMLGAATDEHIPNIEQLGFVSDPQRLQSIYAAADLLCLPSTEENLAQTGIESLALGTPVVCFAGTGPADYVVNHKTGLQAPHKTVSSLADTINRALEADALSDQAKVYGCFKDLCASTYSKERIRALYLNLYQSIIPHCR
jgi:glycosyltransferase involved in cell wall biosynthesis